MAMVNVNNFLNVKDSRWLQLEVCREFQRNKCTRPDTECKFAHPPPNVEVQNGRVTACYDSIKGRCNREKPPCKYFHPPQHLKDQLLINGRNHLALKNALMTQIQGLNPGTPVVPGTIPVQPNSPYLGIPTVGNFNPYIGTSVVPMGMTEAVPSPMTGSIVPQTVVTAQKVPRTDRLEVCREFQRGACKRPEPECRFAHPPDHVTTTDDGTVTVCMDATKSRCSRDPCRYFHPPPHLQAQLRASQGRAAQQPVAFPGMGVPYKRTAGDKSGVPVYQPTGNAAYQQALMQQIGGQSFVPVSSSGIVPTNAASVVYTDEHGQLLDTLQVCRDFRYGQCTRPACKFVHLLEDHVEVTDMRVSVCRDAVKGKCSRGLCKYYHLPVSLPPAPPDAHYHSAAARLAHASNRPHHNNNNTNNNTNILIHNDLENDNTILSKMSSVSSNIVCN